VLFSKADGKDKGYQPTSKIILVFLAEASITNSQEYGQMHTSTAPERYL
jgi:hypothetical protein